MTPRDLLVLQKPNRLPATLLRAPWQERETGTSYKTAFCGLSRPNVLMCVMYGEEAGAKGSLQIAVTLQDSSRDR